MTPLRVQKSHLSDYTGMYPRKDLPLRLKTGRSIGNFLLMVRNHLVASVNMHKYQMSHLSRAKCGNSL